MELRAGSMSVVVMVVTSLLSSAPARANDPVAEHLFSEGRAAARTKDWTRACSLLQESQNREPAPGTLLNLADCEEHRGRLVTSRAQYAAAARLFSAGDARAKYATERAASLGDRIAKLRLLADANLVVECDGAPVSATTFNTFVDVDPGEHVLVVKVAGRADTRQVVRLAEGERRDLVLTSASVAPAAHVPAVGAPQGVRETQDAQRETSPSAKAPPSMPAPQTVPRAAAAGPPSRTPAYLTLGLGAASLGLGVVTGFLAFGAAGDARSACPAAGCATEADVRRAEDAASSARTMATVSTIGVGAGLGAAALGTYLLLRAPSSPVVTPAVGAGSVGLVLQGSM